MKLETKRPPRRHPLLEVRLAAVSRKLREHSLHRRSAIAWGLITLVAVACLVFRYATGFSISWAAPVVIGLIVVATFRAWLDVRRSQLDLLQAVRDIERRFPELRQALRTAYEQRSEDGQFGFLQKRVIAQVLDHADRNVWTPPRSPLRWSRRLHIAAVLAAFGALFAIVSFDRANPGKPLATPSLFAPALTVQPGDAEVEKGSIVMVTARFSGPMPTDAQLEWTIPGSAPRTAAMAKSFTDPLFAHTLPPMEQSLSYRIRYGSALSDEFHLKVYVLPALVRADTSLTYPEYTGLPPKAIGETRRVSAVEGSQLIYDFTVNKPIARAVLQEKDHADVELIPLSDDRTRFRLQMPVSRSHRYFLQLEDQDGRRNNPPIDIRVEALPNRRPDPRVTAPNGDVRVSPIEEVQLTGNARDEFGLLDYGIAISFGGGSAPEYISLKNDPRAPVEVRFQHRLALEERKIQPGDVLTWFAWADDFGPDGNRRRTDGDLQFAEVRPLDEVFREDDSGGGGENQATLGAEEGQELIELQREIALAIWRQRQQTAERPDSHSDLDAILQSQTHVRSQLEKSLEQVTDSDLREKGQNALKHIDRTLEELSSARDNQELAPLSAAWSEAQAAFQEMLKMLPKETRVAQMNQRSRSRGGQRGNQRQINQLEFTQEQNRYETASEAQPLASPEQKEQLQALSKLRELARRQQETNQRLQELQTALNAARDESQREEIRRELKRLEEEQRRLLADTDELRDRMDQMAPSEQTREARQRLDQTREDMRRSGERLEQGEVSSALASGTRAAEDLQQIGDDFRKTATSQFSDQLRQARQDARELADAQASAEEQLNQLNQGQSRSLDDSSKRDEIARSMEAVRDQRESLLQQLRQIAEDSETSEPGLHRRIYDLLREHGQGAASEQLAAGAEMLRRGFVPQAQDAQNRAGRDVQELRRRVERAAESVLGDESAELRYAQSELEALNRQLQRERNRNGREPSDENDEGAAKGESATATPPGLETGPNQTESTSPSPGSGAGGLRTGPQMAEGLRRMLDELRREGQLPTGPLTGEGFGEWIERLRTVEELTDMPEARERLARAREQAEAARREFKRHSRAPEWESVETGIATPLAEARALLRRELARIQDPNALQPIDRDPVPEKYAESVRRYYEALGE